MIPSPYPHQLYEVENFARVPKRALYWSPRIGKTLGAIASMQRNGTDTTRAVVIAPYAVCPTWVTYAKNFGYDTVNLFDMPVADSLDALMPSSKGTTPTVAVVNYQRLGNLAGKRKSKNISLSELLRLWYPQSLIIDESHFIVSPSARWARSTRELAWQTPWVRCLSGTPTPNHYGNLWGQLSALDPQVWGYAYEPFARKWLVRDSVYRTRVLGYLNLEELRKQALSYCSVVRREDVFGPDQWIVNEREVVLPKKAQALYAKLAHEWLIDNPDESLLVNGDHILTRLTRLQQIASGYVVGDDEIERPVHDAKIDAVLSDLSEIVASGEKSIIFHHFAWEGARLLERIAKEYPGVPVMAINGATPTTERERVISAVEHQPGSVVAVVQTQAGGIGISFANSAYAQIMSESFSFVNERQARDRIFKPGVPRHLMYYRAKNTVDEYIADALRNKLILHDSVTNMDKRELVFGKAKRFT